MLKPLKHILGTIVIASIAGATVQSVALAQTTQTTQPTEPIRLDPITVYVYKEKDDAQRLPVSVTGVSESVLRGAGVLKISDAGILAPNTFFSEFTARKLSNARFRGIGSSPLNPGITTYIDGVPQLNTNSSNIEFLDIEQVEFVRGPHDGAAFTDQMDGRRHSPVRQLLGMGCESEDIRAYQRQSRRPPDDRAWDARWIHDQRCHGKRSGLSEDILRQGSIVVDPYQRMGNAFDCHRPAGSGRGLWAQRPCSPAPESVSFVAGLRGNRGA
jgi:TonB-dependent Receptor Plug Domain